MIGTGIGLGLAGYRTNPGNWNPSLISGLQIWLDSSDGSTLYQSSGGSLAASDGDPVGYWADKSGNGRNALQSDGTKKPAFKLSQVNGKPSVRFDGVNDYLQSTIGIRPNEWTLFIVAKKNVSGQNYFCACSDSSGSGHSRYLEFSGGYPSSNNFWFLVGGRASASANTFEGWTTSASTIDTVNFFQANYSFRLSDTPNVLLRKSQTSVTVLRTLGNDLTEMNQNSIFKFGIGCLGEYVTDGFLDGHICELIVYDSRLTESQKAGCEIYLNSKWGV